MLQVWHQGQETLNPPGVWGLIALREILQG